MTADLECMQRAGIGYVVFLEVNVGVPRGTVDFLSEQWQNLFTHAVRESERLGIGITLGVGPGWSGSGGPWVLPRQSMQHLVSSSIHISDTARGAIQLPLPQPKKPFFGEGGLTPVMKEQWKDFYEDVAILAFPAPASAKKIADIDEKALYYRAPYSSAKGVKQFLPDLPAGDDTLQQAAIHKKQVIDLTSRLQADGTLRWKVPKGTWTIMRFGVRNNGAVTRPAPFPGLGFEADKLDTVAMNAHLDAYMGKLLRKTGQPDPQRAGGLKMLHMDSWEMGAQNWTPGFREIFKKRRGYDPLPYYPVYAGNVVDDAETSERFLWDLRLTLQELVLENHAGHLKRYAHRNGMKLSIEPYDMNPTADLELGAVADVPMCEFWSKGFGFNTTFSCMEAVSIAHVNGIPLVPAEAFTAQNNESWKQYPGSMKNQGDWAFATGINRLVYHTFVNQSLHDSLRPGMTMGPYGVHWDRGQTWWPMAYGYHRYIARCQFLLQQGGAVADILYLTPEGAPHVFRPPASALTSDEFLPDRKGYNFDGCSPGQLYAAQVKDNNIVFPGGATYRILVLPAFKTMTPALLEKIRSLVRDGATIVGPPPVTAPGLSGYPASEKKIAALVREVWGMKMPGEQTAQVATQAAGSNAFAARMLPKRDGQQPRAIRFYGKGKVISGGDLSPDSSLYPEYEPTAALLQEMGITEDFSSPGAIRYTHRIMADKDIYFVSNRTDQPLNADGTFRATKGVPVLWDPLTGDTRTLPEFHKSNETTTVPLEFGPGQSFFIVFEKDAPRATTKKNFPQKHIAGTLNGAWTVSFNPKWGGPAKIIFDQLEDWTQRPEEGIKYYSGIATYKQTFNMPAANATGKIYLDLGEVKHMARVRLNGHDLGVVWTAPWQVDITSSVKQQHNELEIEVANLWPNRLIGDDKFPNDGVKDGQWPEWLKEGKPRTSGRYAFATYNPYKIDSPLLRSGLIGPVTIQYETAVKKRTLTDEK